MMVAESCTLVLFFFLESFIVKVHNLGGVLDGLSNSVPGLMTSTETRINSKGNKKMGKLISATTLCVLRIEKYNDFSLSFICSTYTHFSFFF